MKMKQRPALVVIALAFLTGSDSPSMKGDPSGANSKPAGEEIRLIVRADDIGSCHAANEACILVCTDGIARTVEVMVPCPWFRDAARRLREHPEIDVGVHLTLTSEWELYKWGPVTGARSLVDEAGHFFPTTRQRKGFPPNTGFLDARPDPGDVEEELRAQIELARREIPQVSHLTCHMGTPVATPELRAIVEKLAAEYELPLELPGVQRVRGFGGGGKSAGERENDLAAILEKLGPGTWLLVEHPGLDTAEMRAIGHEGYRDVAADRQGVTRAFTSEKVKEIVRRRSIRLISYREHNETSRKRAAQEKRSF